MIFARWRWRRDLEGGRPAFSSLLLEHRLPENRRAGGFVVWFTGLPAAGKSTLAGLVGRELEQRGLLVEYLDGEVMRALLSPELGYSRADRDTHVARLSRIASRSACAGVVTLVSAISPYAKARETARTTIEEFAPFVEVYVAASVETCVRRDPKGLYRRALRGEIPFFTGVNHPYEEPKAPELRVNTDCAEPVTSANVVVTTLEHMHLIALKGPTTKAM
jgi:adenylyl-sulfate kinase